MTHHRRTVGVIGLGFVGLTLASVLASRGFDVIGVDVDEDKVKLISRGKPPFYEPGIEEALSSAGERLRVTTDYNELANADIVFVTVPTPTLPQGEQDTRYVEDAISRLAHVWRNTNGYKLVALKSTVLPGTTRRLASIFAKLSGKRVPQEVGFAANPEFLREGHAVQDLLYPSRVVIGGIDEKSGVALEEFWRSFYKNIGRIPPILRLTAEEAEAVKYASNAFLAMRISFANKIADLCEKIPGCDALRVLDAAGLDPRIGRLYLRPGLGYGGSCLPKDLRALIWKMRRLNIDPMLFEAVERVNEERIERIIALLEKLLGNLQGKMIAVLGLAYKPGTDDIRESRSIELVKRLLKKGAILRVHDPKALRRAKALLGENERIIYAMSLDEALRDAEALVIATDWEEYKAITPELVKKLMKRQIVIDARRLLNPEQFEKAGIEFYAVGRAPRYASLLETVCNDT